MKKIVWLCNTLFTEEKIKRTGSWLQPLAEALLKTSKVEIINISFGKNKDVTQSKVNGICQYEIPMRKKKGYGQIPSLKTSKEVALIINNIQPDIVHIWGTENVWVYIYKQGYIKYPTILEIQGLLFSCADYYYGGLTFKEILKTIHIKEILMPWRSLFYEKYVFKKRGEIEQACIKKIKKISYQSLWVRNQLMSLQNVGVDYVKTQIMLREGFYTSDHWQYKEIGDVPIIFSSASYASPFKGIHVLLKMLKILKIKYPNIQLRFAGNIKIKGTITTGYNVFLKNYISKNGLQDNVVFLGPLNETEIIKELQQTNVCVIPSFIESYCLALAEAMAIGVPSVVSYAGAMPEFAVHGKEALFYNSMDYRTGAIYIDEILQNKELAISLATNASKRRLLENDPQSVLNKQLEIYGLKNEQ